MSASMEPTRMTSKCEIKILTGGRSDFEARIGLADKGSLYRVLGAEFDS